MQGEWNALPSGFAVTGDGAANEAGATGSTRALQESRREEGYADLVGLAWTQRAHPTQYAEVRSWLERFRADAVPGEHHDTGAWLRLARDASAFDPGETLFRQAKLLWEREARAVD